MNENNTIPKIIHQIWIGPRPIPYEYINSWKIDYLKKYKNYTHILWREEEINKLLDKYKEIRDIYNIEDKYHGKADIIRIVILYEYGGIYIDSDCVWNPNKNLDDLIDSAKNTGFFIGRSPNIKKKLANGIIGCNKNNDTIKFIFKKLIEISEPKIFVQRKKKYKYPYVYTNHMLISDVIDRSKITISDLLYQSSGWNRKTNVKINNIKINDNFYTYHIGITTHRINTVELINTHRECYNYILDTLNSNNIQFVIMRGFKYLPVKPDTDLDIVIHPKSYNKFVEIYSQLINEKLIRKNAPKKYYDTEYKKNVYYTPLFTAKHLKEGDHLPGKYYRFDTYSDLFFYKDGEGKGKNAIILNSLFKKYLFDTKIKIDNYYIPNPISEIILLIYRNLYDKRGKWNKKHINRINELYKDINKSDFEKISLLCFTKEQSLIEYLDTKQFNKITKPSQKLNLFIIRKKGMRKDIIEYILSEIKKDYTIIDKILININNKQKFYKKIYGNYEEHKDDIEKVNDNQCMVIITNRPKDPTPLKKQIRNKYKKFYPPIGNIIHTSDSSEDCEKELQLLLNEKIDNFKNIGTYYTTVDI